MPTSCRIFIFQPQPPAPVLEKQSNTMDEVLQISLKEEELRSQILNQDRELQRLQMILVQTQEQIRVAYAYREQVSKLW